MLSHCAICPGPLFSVAYKPSVLVPYKSPVLFPRVKYFQSSIIPVPQRPSVEIYSELYAISLHPYISNALYLGLYILETFGSRTLCTPTYLQIKVCISPVTCKSSPYISYASDVKSWLLYLQCLILGSLYLQNPLVPVSYKSGPYIPKALFSNVL